jgi:RimJ/RimL family protein N-acetyltransferase
MNWELLNKGIVLDNQRALLLPLENDRHQELRDIIFNDEIWRYMGMYVRTEEDLANYVSSALTQKRSGICYPFLVIDKLTNKVAGSTRYGYLNPASEKCEIGWTWYGESFQGTGLNKACKHAMLAYGFDRIGFRRIQFSADNENLRSQRAIEKLGATKEGMFRNNYIDSAGESRDDVYYSIIREDWPRIREERFAEFLSCLSYPS